MDLDRVIAFYHALTPESIGRFAEFYGADAYFKDPFNEVRGVEAIQHIFTHMFRQVDGPRFVVTEHVRDGHGAMLVWEFSYRVSRWGQGDAQVIRGVSHLKFGDDGKINYHRDYWDAAEELYMKLPVIGRLMGWLRSALSAG
ncbi:nuclear transport factor 2 family protein [Zoogloea sp. LCSB751]|uniref:nuclear transport factor 2 family protein n=1 Tax=Zoogloea sp. LCSB751 TaxID=1965277 RepID=UPI0009A4809E|nr:nuclear transport factor 2 family protein [Zoogloea sp. LCSB751]